MSDVLDLGLDLEKLFQPAWAQGKAEGNRFEKFTGNEGAKPERRFDDKPRGRSSGPRRDGGGAGGERRSGPPRGGSKFGDRKGGPGRRDQNRGERREQPQPPASLPEIAVTFLPDPNGVESISRQIKMTGRAYPLFDIARLILDKPERYAVQLATRKKANGTVAQPLFACALDDTPWLSEDEAVAHVLKNHFATFYQTERTATEPPKGKYTFVAQCGVSGVILGPSNHHDYQNQLRKLHAERFSRMPFEMFKSRVKIVKDEAVVAKWIEEQSFKTEFACLNVPEPLKLPNMEEVEKHFRATHKEAIIKPVDKHTVAGVLSRNLRSNGLYRVVRFEWEDQRRFPLQLSTELSRQFAGHGLQFFKVNKAITHVGVARPLFLDLETTPVSESIKNIVGFINGKPKCTRRQLVEALAPSPAVIEIKPEGQSTEPTAAQTAIIGDLHWLIHQGHVLEFADGRMETAKKPLPRPAKPEKKPAKEKPTAEGETPAVTETAEAAETDEAISGIAVETPAEAALPEPEVPAATETISSATEPATAPETIPPAEEVPSPS